MNKKKLFITSLILIVVIFSFNVVAQQTTSSSTTNQIDDTTSSKLSNEPSDETPEINVDEVIEDQPEVELAPQWIIDKTNSFIISKVGKDYFAQYLQLNKSWTNTNIDKIGAKYVLIYAYIHNLKENPDDIPYQVKHQFTLRVDPDGELVEYRGIKYKGPNKPYQFLISKNEAKTIAMQNGLEEPFEVFMSYKDYVWTAWTKTCVTDGNIEGLYIDVDRGEVISKKISAESCIEEVLEVSKKENEVIETTRKVEVKQRRTFFQIIIDWVKSLFKK